MLQMQQPVPIATLSNIVTKITDAILKAAGKQNDVNARSKLQSALTAALNPPGAGPPTAATLELRIRTLLTKLTNAGQKNDLSGQILDANPAKELPAQQKKSGGTDSDSIATDAAALTRALLNDAGGNPQNAAPTPVAAAALQNTPDAAQAAQSASAGAGSDIISRIVGRAVNASKTLSEQTVPGKPVVASPGAVQRAASAGSSEMTALQTMPDGAQPQSAGATHGLFEQVLAAIENAAKDQVQAQPQVQTQAAAGAVPAGQSTAPIAVPAQNVPQTPLAPYTTIDPNAVIEQIVKGIVVNTSGQDSQIRLRLQPESLGEVTMRLTVTGNTVSANVVTQNADVRQMVLSGQAALSKSLAQSGLTLGGFSVNVFGGDAGNRQQSAQQNRPGFKLGGWQAGADTGEEPVTDLRFGPPLVSGPHSLVLNHLV